MNIKKYKTKKQYRFKDYDYSQDGFYFVTICTDNRKMFFGDVVFSSKEYPFPRVELSKIGQMAEKYWKEIPEHFNNVQLDEFMIMPNHIHGIIQIYNQKLENKTSVAGTGKCDEIIVETGQCPVPAEEGSSFGNVTPKSLSTIIGAFKSVVTKNVNLEFADMNFGWQSRFYDRIVRNYIELEKIRKYIIENPAKWKEDRNNPINLK